MTSPSPLIAYLRVQQKADKEIIAILRRAAAKSEREAANLLRAKGIGAQVRAHQLQLASAAMKREQARMWRELGNTIAARRLDAAAAAAETATTIDAVLARAVGRADAIALLREANLHTARVGIEHLSSRLAGHHPLSYSVYRNSALASGRIDRIVNEGIARGLNARSIAKEVKAFILPSTPGGASYAAMRLGRTELNNAFHATQVRIAATKPWVEGMRWNISNSHPRPDECDEYAEHDGTGIWPVSEVPGKPHPHCLCYVTSETVSRASFVDAYNSGAYDSYLDGVLANAG